MKPAASPTGRPLTMTGGVIVLLATLAVGGCAVSGGSLWIDEFSTAYVAQARGLGDWWQRLTATGGSTVQMPAFTLWLTLWEKLFGHTEWALRAANLPWLLLATVSVARALRHRQRVAALFFTVFLSSPFLWYYLDEARPYVMQICGGALVLAGLLRFCDAPIGDGWLSRLLAGWLLVAASNLLGVFLCAASAALFLCPVNFQHLRRAIKKQLPLTVTIAALLVALGIFYAWTLSTGTGGAKLWAVGWSNLAQAAYELAGLGGLGPARAVLRELGGGADLLAGLRPWRLPLTLGAVVVGLVTVSAALGWCKTADKRRVSLALTVLLTCAALLMATSAVMQWPFWGRHLAMIFPFIVFVLADGLSNLPARRAWQNTLTVLLLTVALTSAVRQRFAPAYGKDNYHAAQQIAAAAMARGQTVWWLADPTGWQYYAARDPAAAPPLMSAAADSARLTPPQLIIISKPDIYDASGTVRAYIATHHYRLSSQLNAFRIYQQP
jgi:hypothetical protein